MFGFCLSKMASEYFYLKSCRKHRFPEASIYKLLSAVYKQDGFYVQLWRRKIVSIQRSHFVVTIMVMTPLPKKTSLHPNQKKKKKETKNREYDLDGE